MESVRASQKIKTCKYNKRLESLGLKVPAA